MKKFEKLYYPLFFFILLIFFQTPLKVQSRTSNPTLFTQNTCNVSTSTSNGDITVIGLTDLENVKLFDANISSVWDSYTQELTM